MRATVTYPYRDRETGEVHLVGEVVELTAERYGELSQRNFVGECQPVPGQAEPAPPAGPAAKAEPAVAPEPTVAQLRAAIEAKGGFAPKKATKAQLASILGSL